VPFYNRVRELEIVRRACQSDKSELFIVYGRRGIGKSTLLAEAVRGMRHIFYKATRETLPLQLEGLTGMVREAYPDVYLPGSLSSFQEFLQFLVHTAEQRSDELHIAILDELPYLADADAGLLTALQHWRDQYKSVPNLKVFLAGSYVSFMETSVLDVNAPLYNRRTGSLRVEPLDYREASLFFPSYSPRDRIEAYAILGGMPSYLEQFDPDKAWEENLLDTALQPSTYLHEEPNWLLLEDLRRDVIYGSILRAIAVGNRKPSDIARAIGRSSASAIAPWLQTLVGLHLVRREVPITDRNRPGSRNSLYWLDDNYLTFYYRYVDSGRSLIAQGRGDRVLERIRASFHEFVARPPFEQVCRQFLWRAYAARSLPTDLEFDAVGSWWNGSHEIDIVAQEGTTTTLVGSCKWTNAPVDRSDLNALQRTLATAWKELNPVPAPWCALFSREGFAPELVELASNPGNRVLLFSPEDLFGV